MHQQSQEIWNCTSSLTRTKSSRAAWPTKFSRKWRRILPSQRSPRSILSLLGNQAGVRAYQARGPSFKTRLVAGSSGVGGAGGVVTGAGSRHESAAAAWRDNFDLDSAERAIAPGVGRIVGQRVLIANVVRHLLADVVHVFDVLRKIREATGGFGDFLKRASCTLGALFALFAQQTDGVDDRIGLLDFANGFLQ